MNTTGSARSFSVRITASVKVSQPLLACEAALWARTVRTALSNSTPCQLGGSLTFMAVSVPSLLGTGAVIVAEPASTPIFGHRSSRVHSPHRGAFDVQV